MTVATTTRAARALRCPRCRGRFPEVNVFRCERGHAFFVSGGVPRLLAQAWRESDRGLASRTADAFGEQWTKLGRDASVTRADLLMHLPSRWNASVFAGLVLDAGCGTGRYAALVAEYGAEVIGLDASRAVDEAARLHPELSLIQADLAAPPFKDGTFDLVYSFGVLHHLPDPVMGLHASFRLVRSGGRLLVWVYSRHGGVFRRGRRLVRRMTARAPALVPLLAAVATGVLWTLYLWPHRLARRAPARLSFYGDKGLRQLYVDCHDALAAPAEIYLGEEDCRAWLESLPAAEKGFEQRRDGSGWLLWAIR